MVGVAHTLRYLPLREDLFKRYGNGMNAQKRAVEQLRPGHVLVMDARRDTSAKTLGDILALRAQQRGAAGVVTDGGLRDSVAVTELGLPVYHGGAHPPSSAAAMCRGTRECRSPVAEPSYSPATCWWETRTAWSSCRPTWPRT